MKVELYLKIVLSWLTLSILFLAISVDYVSAEEINLAYDAVGNLVSGDGFCREYDGFNHLSTVFIGDECSGTPLETYLWHPLEEKIILRDIYWPNGTLRETIHYFGDSVILQNSSGEYYQNFVYADGQLVAFEHFDGKKYYVLPDHLGSANVILDEDGNIVEEYFFSPFGEILIGGEISRYSYTGREFNQNTQDYDLLARRYRADLAMFTQPDKIIPNVYDPQQLNRYSYARNNPYRYVDPNGKWTVQVGGSATGGAGGAGTLGGGVIFGYSQQGGFQGGLYSLGGGGGYLGSSGTAALDLSYSNNDHIEDIEGFTYTSGGSATLAALGGIGGLSLGGEVNDPTDDFDSKEGLLGDEKKKKKQLYPSYTLSLGLSGGSIPAEAHTFSVFTNVKSMFGGGGKSSGGNIKWYYNPKTGTTQWWYGKGKQSNRDVVRMGSGSPTDNSDGSGGSGSGGGSSGTCRAYGNAKCPS